MLRGNPLASYVRPKGPALRQDQQRRSESQRTTQHDAQSEGNAESRLRELAKLSEHHHPDARDAGAGAASQRQPDALERADDRIAKRRPCIQFFLVTGNQKQAKIDSSPVHNNRDVDLQPENTSIQPAIAMCRNSETVKSVVNPTVISGITTSSGAR